MAQHRVEPLRVCKNARDLSTSEGAPSPQCFIWGARQTSRWHSEYAEPAPKPLPNAAKAARALPPPADVRLCISHSSRSNSLYSNKTSIEIIEKCYVRTKEYQGGYSTP